MKRIDRTDQQTNTMREQSMRISRIVKTQIFIISALLASSVLAFIIGNFSKVNSNIQNFFLSLSGSLIVAVMIFLFLERGIKSLHPIGEIRNLPVSEFIEKISKVKQGTRIRILETFTSLTNEYQTEFAEAIKQANENGAKIEVLLFHPFSEGAKKRAQQLRGHTNVEEELRKNLARLYDLQSTLGHPDKSNLCVKLYNALPSIAMYRCGEWAYVSLFPIGKRADRCPNLKVPMDTPFGSYVDDIFDELWAGTFEAPTISLDSHMCLRIGSTVQTHSLPHQGHYFAYAEEDGYVDRTKCFVVEQAHTLFFSIYDDVKEKDKVNFYLDEMKWQAVPHHINARDPKELEEYKHAHRLIERRYDLAEGKLGGSSIIIRFQDIEVVINEETSAC